MADSARIALLACLVLSSGGCSLRSGGGLIADRVSPSTGFIVIHEDGAQTIVPVSPPRKG